MDEEIEERKQKIFSYFKKDKNYLVFLGLAIIAWFGYFIRTRNLGLLIDVTTGNYIPMALDPHVFLRYAKYIIDNGSIMAIDYMRNYPVGFPTAVEGKLFLLPYFVAYLYKFLHFFNSSLTLEKVHILYPPIAFIFGLIFFFLLIRKLFNYKIALFASFLLTIIPTFLYRTSTGFSDKESLAIFFMFATFYFYVKGWHYKNIKKNILFGVLAGLFGGLTGMVWGGVNFIFMIMGLFIIIEIFLNKFNKNDFFLYSSFVVVLTSVLVLFGRYSLMGLFGYFTSEVMYLALLMGFINYFLFDKSLFKIKDRIGNKLPKGINVLIISGVLGLLGVTVLIDPMFIINKPSAMINDLLYPLGDRWAKTVAESHEPYISDWISNLGWKYVLFFIIGSIVLFYEAVKVLSKHKRILTIGYGAFIFSFIFSRYSISSILDGVSPIARFMYLGSIVMFGVLIGGIYLYTYFKDREIFDKIKSIDKRTIFVLIWFIIMVMAARRAIRLLFVFSPIITVLASFLVFYLFDKAKTIKLDYYKIAAYIAILFLVVNPFVISTKFPYGLLDKGFVISHMGSSLDQAKYLGPSYNRQWQVGMQWVRENTPEDAVFAHWWDYGYWVQTGGNRATITDGGNMRGDWNHFMGRHVLTGQSDREALDFLYAHNASYLLMVSDEIGKYPAFSSIGADENYDRYSWVREFILDPNIVEGRNESVYLYRGGIPLDQDFIYQDKLFPRQTTGVGGVMIPVRGENGSKILGMPTVALFYNNEQVNVPLNCIFYNGEEITFDSGGMDGCFMIIPKVDGDKADAFGAGLFLSETVRKSRFTQYYLFGKESPYFKLVYGDSSQIPLLLYNGRIIGPMKIWEISYPNDIEFNEGYITGDIINPNVYKI